MSSDCENEVPVVGEPGLWLICSCVTFWSELRNRDVLEGMNPQCDKSFVFISCFRPSGFLCRSFVCGGLRAEEVAADEREREKKQIRDNDPLSRISALARSSCMMERGNAKRRRDTNRNNMAKSVKLSHSTIV